MTTFFLRYGDLTNNSNLIHILNKCEKYIL